MPAYQFRCPKCSAEKELIFSMSENHRTICDACKCLMDKVFASPGIILKGTGWGKN